MRVYILDFQSKNLEQILTWLSQDKRIEDTEVFENYTQFIEKVENLHPDLCFIRIGEYRISGLKAGKMVKQISPETRIVFMADDRAYALDAYEAGAWGYLLNPVERTKFEKCFAKRKYNDST